MASAAVYPNIRSAAAFQEAMVPSTVFEMMASSEDSTTAARRACARLAIHPLASPSNDGDACGA
jgi:hypothetical protein